MIFKCPHCREEISEINYTSDVTEYGTAIITTFATSDPPIASDHDCTDSETQETRYTCPECDRQIAIEDVIVEPTPNQPQPAKEPNNDSADDHDEIINPSLSSQKQIDNTIVCKNRKCNAPILIEIAGEQNWIAPLWATNNREEWIHMQRRNKNGWQYAPVTCPKCGRLNDPSVFFEKIRNQLIRKKSKPQRV